MNELDSFIKSITKEDFSSLLQKKLKKQPKEGTIVTGVITNIVHDNVLIDVGLKTEGMIPLSEFKKTNINVGDNIEIFVEKLEDRHGLTQLSFDRVAKEKSWAKFEKAYEEAQNINGKIIGKLTKGGYAVEIENILAFLPGSQLDIKQVKDPTKLYHIEQQFKVLKIDRNQGNVVVSRRLILEDSRKEAKEIMLSSIKEGMEFKGIVKNITNYGAFIDLGEIDGLLHMSDISWNRISHPTELLSLGEKVNVIVIKYNKGSQRISLGIKQLIANPWKGMDNKFVINQKYKGIVSEINDFGIFIEMCDDKNIVGLVYPNEISWDYKRALPKDFVQHNQQVEVKVLEIDISKHRLSLSIKRCTENPWKKLLKLYPEGSQLKTKIVKILDFGLLVTIITENKEINKIKLLVPATELDWNSKPKESLVNFKIGNQINCMILNHEIEKERVILSIKRLEENDIKKIAYKLIQKRVVTCTIVKVDSDELIVEINKHIKGFIKKIDLSKDKSEQNPNRFTVGDRIDAKAISFNKIDRILKLSVKQLEFEEERRTINDYGSVNSGASLADILGTAIRNNNKK